MEKLNKAQRSWVVYDMAYSAYSILYTVFLPVLMKLMAQMDNLGNSSSTMHWGYVQSISTLVVAVFAPTLGALADYQGLKKLLFLILYLISVVTLAIMVICGNYHALLFLILICQVGFSGSLTIYNSYLIDITENKKMNYISSLRYALGYGGRCFPYVISIMLYYFQPFNITKIIAIKISIIITIIWWVLFSLPFLLYVKQKYGKQGRPKWIVVKTMKNTLITFLKVIKNKNILMFLLAYFFYNNGVSTIISMSTVFGFDLGISVLSLALSLLVTQIVAAPSVLVFERLSRKFTTKSILLFSIYVFMAICMYAFFLKYSWQFWIMTVSGGLVLGTIQALSNSFFGRLIPNKDQNSEYFGIYNVFSRYSSVIGPSMMSIFTAIANNSRYGLASTLFFFVIGFIFLYRVPNIDKTGVNRKKSFRLSN